MQEYVIQIEIGSGWLAKSFPANGAPIPGSVPAGRIQIIMTNGASFDAIIAVYEQYTTNAIFSYDEPGAKIDCTGAVTDSWPIN